MHRALAAVAAALLTCASAAQASSPCSCGSNPPGRPIHRSMKPYAGAPADLQPYSKFTSPYYENYTDLIEYNGAARDVADPNLNEMSEIRIGFLAPLYD